MKPKRCKLTRSQIETIRKTENQVDALLLTWRMIEPRWDDLETINPSDYQIPRWQAMEILDGRGAIADMGGIWLNNGPSTYDAEPMYSDEPEYERTGNVLAVMVGDDRRHSVDPSELTPLKRSEFCGECGQVGCHCDGYPQDDE